MKLNRSTSRGLFIWTLLVSGSAIADDYGRWLCTTCTLSSDPGQPADGDTDMFIRSIVNSQGGPGSNGWQLGDTVTVCNGVRCGTFVRGMFGFATQSMQPDDGSAYRNGSGASSGGGDPGGSPGAGGSGGGGSGPRYGWRLVCGTVNGTPSTCVWEVYLLPP